MRDCCFDKKCCTEIQESSSQHLKNPINNSPFMTESAVWKELSEMHSDSEASAAPPAVSSSNLIFIFCNYPQESCFITCHTAGAYSQLQPASRSSQAARHRASLKLLNALLVPVLPWLQLVDPAFSRTMNGLWSLWLFPHAVHHLNPPPPAPNCLPANANISMPH